MEMLNIPPRQEHDVVGDQVASSSAVRLIDALQRARVDEIHSVLKDTKSARSALLVHGYDCGPSRRTPLMCAIQTGDHAILFAVMRAFDSLFFSAKHRALEMKKQLLARDAHGWTVAMIATRAGDVGGLMMILEEIIRSGATTALMAVDNTRMTLLMHSAAAGNAAKFRQVVEVLDWAVPKDQMNEYLGLKSANGRTLLMIAAQSSDVQTFLSCVEVLRLAFNPHDFRMLIMKGDDQGMNFLMHAANPDNKSISTASKLSAQGDDGNDCLRTAPACAAAQPISGVRGDDQSPQPRHIHHDEKEEEKEEKKSESYELKTGEGAYETKVAESVGSGSNEAMLSASRTKMHPATHEQELEQPLTPPDSRVVLLKAALSVNETCLWKTQAREMLSSIDLWGRTLVSHAILSRSPQVFLASVSALRVLGAEAVTILEDAVDTFAWDGWRASMKGLVYQQLLILQEEANLRANGSGSWAQIIFFCPVKLLVIFHLVLPEVTEKLALLLIMSSLAPLLELAHDVLLTSKTPQDPLAMRVLEVEAGWTEGNAAVMLAVGAVIIPATDSFFNSLRFRLWLDKSAVLRILSALRSTRLERQEERLWKELKTETEEAREKERTLLSKGSTSFVRGAFPSGAATPNQPVDGGDIETAMTRTNLVVAGDEWEVLAEGLQAGRSYVSKDGDVRLEVQPGSLTGSVPDFVKLHLSTQLHKSNGQDYITDTIVHCPPNVDFQDPLLLDFLLGNPAISGGKSVLAEVLQEYQVLRKNDGDETWEPMEQEDIELVHEAGATYLRARIYHFTCFCKGKVSDDVPGIQTDEENTNEQGFTVSNLTNKTLYLVRVPLRFAIETESRRQTTYNLGISVGAGGISAGPSVGAGFEREARTVWVSNDKTAGVPLQRKVLPMAKKQMLNLVDKDASERLIVCTVEDELSSSTVTPTPATPTSPLSGSLPAPATGATVDVGTNPSQIQILRYLGDHVMVGKKGVIYSQGQVAPQAWLSSARVDTQISRLVDVTMALAGLIAPAPAPAPAAQQPSQTTTWRKRFLRL